MITVSPRQVDELRRITSEIGFAELPLRVPEEDLNSLGREADRLRTAAQYAEQSSGLQYRARIAPLPPRAVAFLSSVELTDMLAAVFGGSYVLTRTRSCLTFYEEGDRLGPHVDSPAHECEVTIIVCLKAVGHGWGGPCTGLELRVYGRQKPEPGAKSLASIATLPGAIVVGHGSQVWHERPILQTGERVAALTGCYGRAA